LFENCGAAGCPICALREWAGRRLEDNCRPDAKILSGGSKANDTFTYTLAELAGASSERMRDPTKITTMTVLPWISHKPARKPDKPVIALEGPKPSFGREIRDLIAERKKTKGDERGDPLRNPWPMRLEYDGQQGVKKKDPGAYYKAYRLDDDDAPFGDAERTIFDTKLSELDVDMEALTAPGDCGVILDFLRQAWCSEHEDLEFADFQRFYEKRVGGFSKAEPKDKAEPKGKGKGKQEPKDDEDRQAAPEGGGDAPMCTNADCPKKGKALAEGTKFCPACGEKTQVPDVPDTKCPNKKCEKYGKLVLPNKQGRCPECGKYLFGDPGVV
jgi:hypothetical protein